MSINFILAIPESNTPHLLLIHFLPSLLNRHGVFSCMLPFHILWEIIYIQNLRLIRFNYQIMNLSQTLFYQLHLSINFHRFIYQPLCPALSTICIFRNSQFNLYIQLVLAFGYLRNNQVVAFHLLSAFEYVFWH